MIGLWHRIKGWLAVAGLSLAALVAAWVRGRREGRQEAKDEEARARVEAARQAREIDNEVDALGADDLDERYRRWLRDD